MDTLSTIKTILSENLEIDPDTITLDSTIESLGIDSLDLVELICEVEDRLNIDMGEPEDLNTIGDLITYIESR